MNCPECGEEFDDGRPYGFHWWHHHEGEVPPPVSKEQILSDIESACSELNRPPKWKEMSVDYSLHHVRNHFSGWRDAVSQAVQPSYYEILADIRTLADDLGRTPKKEEFVESVNYRFRRDWTDAVIDAGLTPIRRTDITKEDVISDIKALADELGKTPTYEDFIAFADYAVVDSRFESWDNAVKAAGLEPNRPGPKGPDRDEILDDIRAHADELGRTPTKREFNSRVDYSTNPVCSRFGSWTAAVMEARLEPNWGRSTDDYAEDIRALAEELGRRPSTSDLDEHADYTVQALYNHWDSWDDALETAGVS